MICVFATFVTSTPGDAYGYRFEKGSKAFVYASDSSYPDGMDMRPYLNFFNDADVLIFDAHFTQRESDEKEGLGPQFILCRAGNEPAGQK